MLKEEAKDFLPIIQAWADGKTIQLQESNCVWVDANCLDFSRPLCRYRIKPEKKLRAWKTSKEVPIGAAFKHKGIEDWVRYPVLVTNEGIFFVHPSTNTDSPHRFTEIEREYLYTLDGGKTWSNCGVEE